MANRHSIIIISLAATLSVVFVWFVVIDNYLVPSQQQQMLDAYQNGYTQGTEDTLVELFYQISDCQKPTSIWIGNNTKQIIDVVCLQPINSDSEISNNDIFTSP